LLKKALYFEEEHHKKKILSRKEAKLKATDYCAYQERSQQQVRDKLYDYGLHQDEVEEVLSELIVEDFINEERFSKAYAGGKFRMKKWGRSKIIQGLKHHRISEYCIKQGLLEIEEEQYRSALKIILERKRETTKANNDYQLNVKVAQYALGRGYESNLVWELLKEFE
jgi:regulatory protein